MQSYLKGKVSTILIPIYQPSVKWFCGTVFLLILNLLSIYVASVRNKTPSVIYISGCRMIQLSVKHRLLFK